MCIDINERYQFFLSVNLSEGFFIGAKTVQPKQRQNVQTNIFYRPTYRNLKKPVELGYPNTCAEAKLRLFLFIPALEIVCSETKVHKTVSSR